MKGRYGKKPRSVLPKGFTKGLKDVAGDFAWGVWDGMSPGKPKRKPKSFPAKLERED